MSEQRAAPTEGDLYSIMGAVQALVDEMLPPDELGQQDHTPALLERMHAVQNAVSDALGLPRRDLIPPDA